MNILILDIVHVPRCIINRKLMISYEYLKKVLGYNIMVIIIKNINSYKKKPFSFQL